MSKIKSEPTKTVLTISVGFLIIFLITEWQWAIYVSLLVGLVGMFSPFLAKQIDWLWMKLAWLLSLVVPNILLSAIFYLFLFPIALLSKLFGNNDNLLLKNKSDSTLKVVHKTFEKSTFEKMW
jgi:hypothetical protein